VLVKEMAALRAEASEPAAKHALTQDQIRRVGAAAAVEALLRAIVDAGNAHRGQLGRHDVEGKVSEVSIAAEALPAAPLANLIVVVHERDDLIAVPAMAGLVEDPVAEQREVVRGVALAGDHPLQLAGDIVDAQGRVQAGLLHDFPGILAAARYFSDQEE